MLLLRPPTHRLAALGIVISCEDPAWDTERIDREINAAQEAAHAKDPDADLTAIRDRHPALRYQQGLTRFQPDASDWDLDDKPTTAAAYLKPDKQPTRFIVRRLGWQEVEAASLTPGLRAMCGEFIRRALVEIQDPTGNFNWKLADGQATMPGDILQALWSSTRDISGRVDPFTEIGLAARNFSAPLMAHEGKHSGCGDSAKSPAPQPSEQG